MGQPTPNEKVARRICGCDGCKDTTEPRGCGRARNLIVTALDGATDRGRKEARASRGHMLVIEDVVWCDKHGEVHDDTLDPYQAGPDEDDMIAGTWDSNLCLPEAHLKVYRRKRKDEVVE